MNEKDLPKFGDDSGYVCPNDSIKWEQDGFELAARIEQDAGTPDDYDCYTEEDKERWEQDEWWFGLLVISVSKNGVGLEDCADSLGGLEVNLGPSCIRYGNDWLSQAIREHGMDKTAIDVGEDILRTLCESCLED